MKVSRRKLLQVSGVAVCAGAIGCGPDSLDNLPATIAAGNVADLSQGTLKAVQGAPVAIGRDSAGIYAMSVICTHAGCDMAVDGVVSAGSVQCFCHGSVFDAQGAVLRGPANVALQHFVVTMDSAGNLTIHGDQTTAAGTRLPAT